MNTKQHWSVLAFALFFLCTIPAFSQVAVSGKMQVNTGWLHLTMPTGTPVASATHDVWTSNGYAQLNLETEGSQTIKGYLSGSYSVYSPDMNEFAKNSMAVVQTAALDRAYVKIRLPWLDGRKMRLNIGKMPVSWGYGMVYNAGDIIFGAAYGSDESSSGGIGIATSESSLSEMRAAADWFVQASLPLVSGITFDPLLRLPLAIDIMDTTDTSQAVKEQQSSFGGRFLWTPYWQKLESAEIGYLASRDGKTHYAYGGLDGTLYVDYNFCAQVRIDSQDSSDPQWVLSGAIAKIFIFTNYDTGYELPLSIRIESLYTPTQNNHCVIFAFASAQVTDVFGLALNWVGTIHDGNIPNTGIAHLLSASLILTPINGLEFTLSSFIDAENPSDMVGINVGTTYRF